MQEHIPLAVLARLFDAFDIDKVALDRPAPETVEWHESNMYYGIARQLKGYCKLREDSLFPATVSHGHFINHAWQVEVEAPLPAMLGIDTCYTKYLGSKTTKPAFAIGPYTFYSQTLVDAAKLAAIKEILGKTLLVVPPHSTHHATHQTAEGYMESCIAPYKGEFAHVLVLMYWKDVLLGRAKTFADQGFVPVCAGHMYDEDFLPRLKGILALADSAAIFQPGTFIPYWVAENKPFVFYRNAEKVQVLREKGFENDIPAMSDLKEWYYQTLHKYFGQYAETPSAEGMAALREICGLDCLREPEELRALLRLGVEAANWQEPLSLEKWAGTLFKEGRHTETKLLLKELYLRGEVSQGAKFLMKKLAVEFPEKNP